jgi:hypothetical protein
MADHPIRIAAAVRQAASGYALRAPCHTAKDLRHLLGRSLPKPTRPGLESAEASNNARRATVQLTCRKSNVHEVATLVSIRDGSLRFNPGAAVLADPCA